MLAQLAVFLHLRVLHNGDDGSAGHCGPARRTWSNGRLAAMVLRLPRRAKGHDALTTVVGDYLPFGREFVQCPGREHRAPVDRAQYYAADRTRASVGYSVATTLRGISPQGCF